jgi:hypothetical protein
MLRGSDRRARRFVDEHPMLPMLAAAMAPRQWPAAASKEAEEVAKGRSERCRSYRCGQSYARRWRDGRRMADSVMRPDPAADDAHELLPGWLAATVPPLYSQEGTESPLVRDKLFTPDARWTWFVLEYDPAERLCLGLVCGQVEELVYFRARRAARGARAAGAAHRAGSVVGSGAAEPGAQRAGPVSYGVLAAAAGGAYGGAVVVWGVP